MGIWARGPSPLSADPAGIAAAMRPALHAWMTAHIRIYDPRRYAVDPVAALVADSGPNGAIIQPLRSPYSIESGSQPGSLMAIRFQMKMPAVEEGQVLRGGLVAKVIDGGNAQGLERYVFALPETIDSSLAWESIIEASVSTGS